MMSRVAWELILALIAIVAITLGYAFLAHAGTPKPGGLVGHTLGIVGFLMMLSTETMYSLRKRLPGFTRGQMSTWLQCHIFTGLVGSYLVVLHSAWKFNGLAGVLTLLTLVVVVSGLVGRFIYTAVPRSLDGVVIAAADLQEQIDRTDARLSELGVAHLSSAALSAVPTRGWLMVLARPWLHWRQRRQVRRLVGTVASSGKISAAQLHRLVAERQRLERQIQSLEAARQLLALWHFFHVPLSGVLFALAFAHIAAALYYATFQK